MHLLSFYNSVTFHPNGKSIIPGSLRYVYTLTGEKEDLFPESDCTFSNCALRSLKDGDSLFTHCPAEPKGISIWDMVNGQKIFIDCEKYIFSFTVSDDGSLIAFSNPEVDHYGTITVFDSNTSLVCMLYSPTPWVFSGVECYPSHRIKTLLFLFLAFYTKNAQMKILATFSTSHTHMLLRKNVNLPSLRL